MFVKNFNPALGGSRNFWYKHQSAEATGEMFSHINNSRRRAYKNNLELSEKYFGAKADSSD
jgi:hypothetical protein